MLALTFPIPLELRPGRRLLSPNTVIAETNPSTSAATTSAQPAGPTWTVNTKHRDPPVFAGLRGDDVEDWIDHYNRVSEVNHWDDTHKLRYVSFYLTEVAKTWFFNHESDFSDWPSFTQQFRQIFGMSSGRSEIAKQRLATRVQDQDESYTSYIEDVLALCRRAQSDMAEADRVRHILKGINTVAFNALVMQSPNCVRDTTACQRLERILGISSSSPVQTTHHLV